MSDEKEVKVVLRGDASELIKTTSVVATSLDTISKAADKASQNVAGMKDEFSGVAGAASSAGEVFQKYLQSDSMDFRSLEGTAFLEPLTSIMRNFSIDMRSISKQLRSPAAVGGDKTTEMQRLIGFHGASVSNILEAVQLYNGVFSQITGSDQQQEFKKELASLQRRVSEFVFKGAYQSIGGAISDESIISAINGDVAFQKGIQKGFAQFGLTQQQMSNIVRATVLNSGYHFLRSDYLQSAQTISHLPSSSFATPALYSYDYRDRLPDKFRYFDPHGTSKVSDTMRRGKVLSQKDNETIRSLALRDPMFMEALERQALAIRESRALDSAASRKIEYAFLDDLTEDELARAVGSYWRMGISKWEGAPMFYKRMSDTGYKAQRALAGKDSKGVQSFLEGLQVLSGIDFGDIIYDDTPDNVAPLQSKDVAQIMQTHGSMLGRKIVRAQPTTTKITPDQYQIMSLTMSDFLQGKAVDPTWKHPTGKYGEEQEGISGYAMISESPLTRIIGMYGHNTFGNGSKTNNESPIMFQIRVGEQRFKKKADGSLEFGEPDANGMSLPLINPEYEEFIYNLFGDDLSQPKFHKFGNDEYAPFTIKDGKVYMIRRDRYEAALEVSRKATKGLNVFNNFADGMLFKSNAELAKIVEARNRGLSPGVTIGSYGGSMPDSSKLAFVDTKFLTGIDEKHPGNDGASFIMPGYIPDGIAQGRLFGVKGVFQSFDYKEFIRQRYGLGPGDSFYVPGLNGIDVMRSRLKKLGKANPTEKELEDALRQELRDYGTSRFTQRELDKYFVDIMKYEGMIDKTAVKTPAFRKRTRSGEVTDEWLSNAQAQKMWEAVAKSSGGFEIMTTGEGALSFQNSLPFQASSHLRLTPEQLLQNNRMWNAYIAKLSNNATAAQILFGGNTKLDREVRANPSLISSSPMASQRVIDAINSARISQARGEIFGQGQIITALAGIDPISFFDRLAFGLSKRPIDGVAEGLTDKEVVLPSIWAGDKVKVGAGRYPRNMREDLVATHNQAVADIIRKFGGSEHALYVVPELIALMGGGDFDGDEVQLTRGKLYQYFRNTDDYYNRIFGMRKAETQKIDMGEPALPGQKIKATGHHIAQMDYRQGAGIFQMAKVSGINDALSQINLDDPYLRERYLQAGLEARAMYDIDSTFLKTNQLASWTPAAREATRLGTPFSMLFRDIQKAVENNDFKKVDLSKYNFASAYSALQMSLLGSLSDNPVFYDIFQKVMDAQEEVQGIDPDSTSPLEIARANYLRYSNRLMGEQLVGKKIGRTSLSRLEALLSAYNTQLTEMQRQGPPSGATSGQQELFQDTLSNGERFYAAQRARVSFLRNLGVTTENEEAGKGYLFEYGRGLSSTDDSSGFESEYAAERAAQSARSYQEIARELGLAGTVGSNRILTEGMQMFARRRLLGEASGVYGEKLPTFTNLRQMIEWSGDYDKRVIMGINESKKTVHTEVGDMWDAIMEQWAYRRMKAEHEGIPLTEEWQKETTTFLQSYLEAMLSDRETEIEGLLDFDKVSGKFIDVGKTKIRPSIFRGEFATVPDKIEDLRRATGALSSQFLNKRILGVQVPVNPRLGKRINGETMETMGFADLLMQDLDDLGLEVWDGKTSANALNEFRLYSRTRDKRDSSGKVVTDSMGLTELEEDPNSAPTMTGAAQTLTYAAYLNRVGFRDPFTKQLLLDKEGKQAKVKRVGIIATSDAPYGIMPLLQDEEFTRVRELSGDDREIKAAQVATQALTYADEMIRAYGSAGAPKDFLVNMRELAKITFKDGAALVKNEGESDEDFGSRLKRAFTSDLLQGALSKTIGDRSGQNEADNALREALLSRSSEASPEESGIIREYFGSSKRREQYLSALAGKTGTAMAENMALNTETAEAAKSAESLRYQFEARQRDTTEKLLSASMGLPPQGQSQLSIMKARLDSLAAKENELKEAGSDKRSMRQWDRLQTQIRAARKAYDDLIGSEATAGLSLFIHELSKPIESPALQKIRQDTEALQQEFREASAAYDALLLKKTKRSNEFTPENEAELQAAQAQRDVALKMLEERVDTNSKSGVLTKVAERDAQSVRLSALRQELGLEKPSTDSRVAARMSKLRSMIAAEYEDARQHHPEMLKPLEEMFSALGITVTTDKGSGRITATFDSNSDLERRFSVEEKTALQQQQQELNSEAALLGRRYGKSRAGATAEERARQKTLSERSRLMDIYKKAKDNGLDTSALSASIDLMSDPDFVRLRNVLMEQGQDELTATEMLESGGILQFATPENTEYYKKTLEDEKLDMANKRLQIESRFQKAMSSRKGMLKKDFVDTKSKELQYSFMQTMRDYVANGGTPTEDMIAYGQTLGLGYDKDAVNFSILPNGVVDENVLASLGLIYESSSKSKISDVLSNQLKLGLQSGKDATTAAAKAQRQAALASYLTRAADAYGADTEQYKEALSLYNNAIADIESGAFEQRTGDAYDATRKLQRQRDAEMQRRMEYQNAHHRTFPGKPTFFQRISNAREQMVEGAYNRLFTQQAQYDKWNAEAKEIDARRVNGTYANAQDAERAKELSGYMNTARTGIQQTEKDIATLNGPMGNVAATMTQVGNMFSRLGSMFGRRIFYRLLSEVTQFVKQFDASMNEIQMITLKTDDQMVGIRSATLNKAINMKTSVSNVAQTEAALYRQGLSDSEVSTRTDAIIKFATVSGTKVQDAVKVVTTALQTGLVDSAEKAIDVLVALGDAAATTAGELGAGLQKAGAAASAAGVSYDELAAMLTITTSKTQLGGKQAGTAFQTLFSRYQKITTSNYVADQNGEVTTWNDFDKALQLVGLSGISDGNGNVKGFVEIMRELSKVWDDLNDAQKSMIANAVAGTKQMNNFYALMEGFTELDENGVSMFDKYFGLSENSEGVTTDKYEIAMQSLNAAINKVKSSFDGLVASLTNNDVLTKSLGGVSAFLQSLTNVSQNHGGIATVFTVIAGGIAAIAAACLVAKTAFAPVSTLLSLIAGLATTSFISSMINLFPGNATKENEKKQESEFRKNVITTSIDKVTKSTDQMKKIKDEYKSLREQFESGITNPDTSNLVNLIKELTTIFPSLTTVIGENVSQFEEWEGKIQKLEERVSGLNEFYQKQAYANIKQTMSSDGYDKIFDKIIIPEETVPRVHTDEEWDALYKIAYYGLASNANEYSTWAYFLNNPAFPLSGETYVTKAARELKTLGWTHEGVGIKQDMDHDKLIIPDQTALMNAVADFAGISGGLWTPTDVRRRAMEIAQQGKVDNAARSDEDKAYYSTEVTVSKPTSRQPTATEVADANNALQGAQASYNQAASDLVSYREQLAEKQIELNEVQTQIDAWPTLHPNETRDSLTQKAERAEANILETEASVDKWTVKLNELESNRSKADTLKTLYQTFSHIFSNSEQVERYAPLIQSTYNFSDADMEDMASIVEKYMQVENGVMTFEDAFGFSNPSDQEIAYARSMSNPERVAAARKLAGDLRTESESFPDGSLANLNSRRDALLREIQNLEANISAAQGVQEQAESTISQVTPTITANEEWTTYNESVSNAKTGKQHLDETNTTKSTVPNDTYTTVGKQAISAWIATDEAKQLASAWANSYNSSFTEEDYLKYMQDTLQKNFIENGSPDVYWDKSRNRFNLSALTGYIFPNNAGGKTVFDRNGSIDEAIKAEQPLYIYRFALADAEGHVDENATRYASQKEAEDAAKAAGISISRVYENQNGDWMPKNMGLSYALGVLAKTTADESKTYTNEALALAKALQDPNNKDLIGKDLDEIGELKIGDSDVTYGSTINAIAAKHPEVARGYHLFTRTDGQKITRDQWAAMIMSSIGFAPDSAAVDVINDMLYDDEGKLQNIFADDSITTTDAYKKWEKRYGSEIVDAYKEAVLNGEDVSEEVKRKVQEADFQALLKETYGVDDRYYEQMAKRVSGIRTGGPAATEQYSAIRTEASEYALATRAMEKYEKGIKLTAEETTALAKATRYSETQIKNHAASADVARSDLTGYQDSVRELQKSTASGLLALEGKTFESLFDEEGNLNLNTITNENTKKYFKDLQDNGVKFDKNGNFDYSGVKVDENSLFNLVSGQKESSGEKVRQRNILSTALNSSINLAFGNKTMAMKLFNALGGDASMLSDDATLLNMLASDQYSAQDILNYNNRQLSGTEGKFSDQYGSLMKALFANSNGTVKREDLSAAGDIYKAAEDKTEYNNMFSAAGEYGSLLKQMMTGTAPVTDATWNNLMRLQAEFESRELFNGYKNASEMASIYAAFKAGTVDEKASMYGSYAQKLNGIQNAQYWFNNIANNNGGTQDYANLANFLGTNVSDLTSRMSTQAGRDDVQGVITSKLNDIRTVFLSSIAAMFDMPDNFNIADDGAAAQIAEKAREAGDETVAVVVEWFTGMLDAARQGLQDSKTGEDAFSAAYADFKKANSNMGVLRALKEGVTGYKNGSYVDEEGNTIERGKLLDQITFPSDADMTTFWQNNPTLMRYQKMFEDGQLSEDAYLAYIEQAMLGTNKHPSYYTDAINAMSQGGRFEGMDANGHLLLDKEGNPGYDYAAWYSSLSDEDVSIVNEWLQAIGVTGEELTNIMTNGTLAGDAIKHVNDQMDIAANKRAYAYSQQVEAINKTYADIKAGGTAALGVINEIQKRHTSISDQNWAIGELRSGKKADDKIGSVLSSSLGITKDQWNDADQSMKDFWLSHWQNQISAAANDFEEWLNGGVLSGLNKEIQDAFNNGDEEIYANVRAVINGEMDASELYGRISDFYVQFIQMIQAMDGTGFKLEEGEDGLSFLIKAIISGGLGTGKPSGGGGGGGGGKSAVDKFLEKLKHELETLDHEMKMLQTKSSSLKDAGFLTLYGKSLEDMNKVLNRRIKLLKEQREKIIAEMAKVKEGSDDWYKLRSQLYATDEALEEATADIDKNTRALEENKKAILQTRIDLQQEVLQILQADEQSRRQKLAGAVELENQILNAIRTRYQKEWELIKQDVEKKKQALQEEITLIDKRLQARKDAESEAEKYEELAELKRQYGLLSMDSSRTKEANELRDKIQEKEKELGWGRADAQANAQKEILSQQMSAYDQYLSEGETMLNEWLEDANNFSDEVARVMALSQGELLKWLSNNVSEFANSLDNAQAQMLDTWTDTWKQMEGVVDGYWTQQAAVEAALQDEETFITLWKQSTLYQNMSPEEREKKELELREMFRSNQNATATEKPEGTPQGEEEEEETKKPWQLSPEERKRLEDEAKKKSEEETEKRRKKKDEDKKEDKPKDLGAKNPDHGHDDKKKLWGDPYKTADDGFLNPSDDDKKRRGDPPMMRAASGGLINYTGPAWLDGTFTNPERVLSPRQTELFDSLVSSLESNDLIDVLNSYQNTMTRMGYAGVNPYITNVDSDGGSSSIGDVYVTINEATLKTDADYEEVAERVGEHFARALERQGLHTTNFSF